MDPKKIFTCQITEWRQKRSLDANGYYWSLLHDFAEWSGRSDISIHNDILSRFGQLQYEEDMLIPVTLREEVDWKELQYIHLRPTTRVWMGEDLRMYRQYLVVRGSHTYDTKEFSRIVDGLIQDIIGSDAPIETMTPAQLATLKGYAA